MTWDVYRWVWRLQSPVYVGMPPAGSINRSRVYVPARLIWGALTAELTRHENPADKDPDYAGTGEWVSKRYRFTYLFPAEHIRADWCAWLPEYREDEGLIWLRQDDRSGPCKLTDRSLRRRLLFTRPSTSIDPSMDAAEDGSLRETECIQTRWRDERGRDAGPVALVGYVFVCRQGLKERPHGIGRIEPIKRMFLGGDSRYGLGHVQRESMMKAKDVFGLAVQLDGDDPGIRTKRILAHAPITQHSNLRGELELVGGWDRGKLLPLGEASLRWCPGSTAIAETTPMWTIHPDGYWVEFGAVPGTQTTHGGQDDAIPGAGHAGEAATEA
jgi:hypothetical protein